MDFFFFFNFFLLIVQVVNVLQSNEIVGTDELITNSATKLGNNIK